MGRASGGMGSRQVNRTLSPRRIAVLVDWVDGDAAMRGRALLESHWRRRGAEVWSAGLAPLRSKGSWRGATPFAPSPAAGEIAGLVASITYARIRPSKMAHLYLLRFPGAARRITRPGSPMLAGIGFSDVPIHHACTFSVWPSSTELDRTVLGRSEPHGAVVRRSDERRWLSESLFARFHVIDHSGTWGIGDPLDRAQP
ncbi:MAG: hypothetical protein ABIX10_15230 [Acidimicrobiales bacterium]